MTSGRLFFDTRKLQMLIDELHQRGYTCIGPQVRDGTIIYDRIESLEQLPQGIRDQQSPGHYRLQKNNTPRYFDWANGPQAIRPVLFPPSDKCWTSEVTDNRLSFSSHMEQPDKIAILGARACDIAALKLYDQHFLGSAISDSHYKSRRESLLVIAVNCSSPAETCFCHSTGDGPFTDDGYDIALTELRQGFLAESLSDIGQSILSALQPVASTPDQDKEHEQIRKAASQQHRQLPSQDIHTGLMQHLESPAWQDIATVCLSCGNCTSVCPTCFCHREFDVPSLDGQTSDHYREWDSCFTQGHSYIHGITIRADTAQRYRQWLTHKFSTWYEQYGRSGCVGCGRCIAWCPVGIDVIESIESVLKPGRKPAHE